MPYDPKAITEDDRSYSYKILWLGLPLSLLLVIGLAFDATSIFVTLSGGFVSGTFIAMAWAGYHDEFARKELAFASGWAVSFAGLVLFSKVIPYGRDFSPEIGFVLAIMSTIFHAALWIYRIKNGAFVGVSE
ncbi:hypothetical protein [Erythrobacter sp. THAF29]|uniref:hypothetical protein n=1 Tax=Erythrobacter sp. THAF29 TaxID=2587851 RepID=UPI001268185E|nr:hypothetical protein [Erythrobacter sp. THAF29]QFT77844.1 hypothetical protein FIU90_09885 [Erythrobacter sp. THAF29]